MIAKIMEYSFNVATCDGCSQRQESIYGVISGKEIE